MIELIKSQNQSPEGNEAIRQINIDLVKKEIIEVEASLADRWERDEIADVEEFEEELEELMDQLDELENS